MNWVDDKVKRKIHLPVPNLQKLGSDLLLACYSWILRGQWYYGAHNLEEIWKENRLEFPY